MEYSVDDVDVSIMIIIIIRLFYFCRIIERERRVGIRSDYDDRRTDGCLLPVVYKMRKYERLSITLQLIDCVLCCSSGVLFFFIVSWYSFLFSCSSLSVYVCCVLFVCLFEKN